MSKFLRGIKKSIEISNYTMYIYAIFKWVICIKITQFFLDGVIHGQITYALRGGERGDQNKRVKAYVYCFYDIILLSESVKAYVQAYVLFEWSRL